MKFHFFAVNALNPGAAQEELNRFCAAHTLLTVEKQFVAAGSGSFWAFCVQTTGGIERPALAKKEKVDYREVLNEADFSVYSKLRDLRKTLAEKEGVPVYSLFTNEQLAAMVRGRTVTEAALLAIEGVGKARVEKYGSAFLPLLRQALNQAKADEANAH
jgi:superfamily II DNA helicase RecQ